MNRSDVSSDKHQASKVWQPLEGTTAEDESVMDGYLELACSPAVLQAGRNKELAMHLLHQLGGSVKVGTASSPTASLDRSTHVIMLSLSLPPSFPHSLALPFFPSSSLSFPFLNFNFSVLSLSLSL